MSFVKWQLNIRLFRFRSVLYISPIVQRDLWKIYPLKIWHYVKLNFTRLWVFSLDTSYRVYYRKMFGWFQVWIEVLFKPTVCTFDNAQHCVNALQQRVFAVQFKYYYFCCVRFTSASSLKPGVSMEGMLQIWSMFYRLLTIACYCACT